MTSTTYAVLGLLCVQPWSAYELAQQMARSLRFMWPRAESGIYREPQKLIDLGYATADEVAAGPRRTKLVYSATPAGRQAFGRWLAQPSAPPQFESEAMVKFFFCDHGTLEDARQALAELQAHGERLLEAFRQATNHHQADSGQFPERQHIGTLTGRFVFEYATALARWAEWAQQHVDEWPDTGPATAPMGARVQRENARLSGTADPPVTQPRLPPCADRLSARPDTSTQHANGLPSPSWRGLSWFTNGPRPDPRPRRRGGAAAFCRWDAAPCTRG